MLPLLPPTRVSSSSSQPATASTNIKQGIEQQGFVCMASSPVDDAVRRAISVPARLMRSGRAFGRSSVLRSA
jgi:hypothetical protein